METKFNYTSVGDTILLSGKTGKNPPIVFNPVHPALDKVKSVKDTTFNFIIRFIKKDTILSERERVADNEENTVNDRGNEIGFWTSETYYNKLKDAAAKNNPYVSVKNSVILSIPIDTLLEGVRRNRIYELQESIDMRINLGIDPDNLDYDKIDYDKIVKYIDAMIDSTNSENTNIAKEYATFNRTNSE
jgi:hypothetical protein